MLFPLVGIAICWTALMLTPYRRNLLAVGGDARAAFTSGVKVSLTRLFAYVLSGVLAAFAGLAFVAVLGSADANAAPSYTLVSLAGAALGGVSMSGGRGSMLGAAAGGATMFLIQNLLGLAQVSVFALQVVFGAALIVALALNSYADHRRRTGHLRRARSEVRQQA
jgi:ribose transport system permease protein